MFKIREILILYSALHCVCIYAEKVYIDDNLVLVNVWINGQDKNIETLMQENNHQYFIECNVFKQLNIKEQMFEKKNDNQEYCLVNKSPVNAEKDEGLQALKINIPAEYFEGNEYSNRLPMPNKASLGAFLNYDLYYGDDGASYDSSILLESGIFKDFWLFENAFLYRKYDNDYELGNKFTRINSSFEVDFPKQYAKLTLGDNTSVYNSLIDSFRFGGISFGTNFTERPDFIYWNIPTLKGSAALPSTVDLYVNGVNLYKQNVAPGHYTVQTGANIQQGGDAQIVVEDIMGNRTVQNFPIYINNKLLRPSLNEYNFSLGKIRYNYSEENNDYREFFSNIYFRRGLTLNTTVGTNIAYSDEIKNLSFLWTQGLNKYALLDMSLTGSRHKGNDGYSLGMSVSRNSGRFSYGISSRYRSDDFRSLGYLDWQNNTKFDNLFYLSMFNLPFLNSFNVNYVERKYYKNNDWSANDDKVLNVGFTKSIGKFSSLSVSYFKELSGDKNNGINLSLSFYLNNHRNIYLDHSTDQDQSRIRYSKYSSRQTGFDYSLGVNRSHSDYSYNVHGLLKTSVGDLSVLHDQSERYRNTQATYSGALVWLKNKVALTKYVDNSFALVKVGDYKDIDVYRSLSLIGATQKNGYLFVHNIIPYVNYDISFNQDQLPMEDTFDYSSQKMIGLNQRGYVFNFPIYKTQQIVVRLLDTKNKILAQGSEVYVAGIDDQIFPVDAQGYTYLYKLKPDKYQIKVKTTGGVICETTLDISKTLPQQTNNQVIDLVCR